MKVVNRNYETLQEVVNESAGTIGIVSYEELLLWVQDKFTHNYWPKVLTYSDSTFAYASSYITEMLNILMLKHQYSYCVFYNDEAEDVQSLRDEFLFMLLYRVETTAQKYLKMLSIYADNEAKLMDQIKAESDSSTRFNDTPQNGGDFSDDSHTTHITSFHNESATDIQTPMARIAEIQDHYRDLIEDWANLFDPMFLHGGNIQ